MFRCLLAEGDAAGLGLVADGGVEAEELPHALALRAAAAGGRRLLPLAGGEVTDQPLQPVAGAKPAAGPPAPAWPVAVVGAHLRAPLGADVA